MNSNSRSTVVLIGDQGKFHQRLAAVLSERGANVLSYDAFAEPDELLDGEMPAKTEFRVVFTPPEENEFELLQRDLADSGQRLSRGVNERMKAFLVQSQTVLNQMMRLGGGQFWVCDYDDSFAYHMSCSASPIIAQARASAVRSIAKEYSRMNIAVNTLFVQPLADEENRAQFRKAAAGLKTYAMRYKPNSIEDVADVLVPFIDTERLAFSGAVISIGTGIQQGHLIA